MTKRPKNRYESGLAEYVLIVSVLALMIIPCVTYFMADASSALTCSVNEHITPGMEDFLFTKSDFENLPNGDLIQCLAPKQGGEGNGEKEGGNFQ